MGPVEIQLGILVLQADPRLKLDAQQVKDVLAVTRAAQKPLVAASTICLGVVRYLRADQLEFLRSHRGPMATGRNESGKALLERSRQLLTRRAAEAGGSLPAVDLPAAGQGGSLSFEDIGAAPLRLEEQAALRLNGLQATEFGKAVDQLLEIDRLENEVATQVRRLLRPEQLQHIAQASAQRETVRRMAPLRLLDSTLDSGSPK